MMYYFIIAVLIGLSGLFSGLTLGLLSLGKTDLERKIKLGNEDAEKIYSVRKKGNLLLCTLLVGNVAVNAAISILLGNITSGIIAGISATALIVVFGEIIPQAVCSRYALKVGAKVIWLVKIFIVIFYPVCFPIAFLLDKILGEEFPTIWDKKELGEIINFHQEASNSNVDADEGRILTGALSFSDKTVEDIMTPRTVVFSLEANTELDTKLFAKIKQNGFTRIPVYKGKRDNVVGILCVKDLIGVKSETVLKDIYRKDNLLVTSTDTHLDDLFNQFKKSKIHMAFVFNDYGMFEGIVTLEDILEEVIGDEILDETDQIADMREKAHQEAKNRFKKMETKFISIDKSDQY